MREDELIAAYLKPLAGKGDKWLLDNDGAAISPYDAAASDCLVEGRHFPAAAEPGFVAEKLLRVNLSDFAAVAAEPKVYLLCLAAPSPTWVAAFAAGLKKAQRQFNLALAGGDLAKSKTAFASATLLGNHCRHPLTRSGAKAGDEVYVSGSLGAAAATKYQSLPTPRLQLGRGLAGLASAAIDVSDGLALDLERLCRSSGVRMRLEVSCLPIASGLKRAGLSVAAEQRMALGGGEDYELAFTAPFRARTKLLNLAAALKLKLTRIGEVMARQNTDPSNKSSKKAANEFLQLVGGQFGRLSDSKKGYSHF